MFVTEWAQNDLSHSESVWAVAGSTLHLRLNRSGGESKNTVAARGFVLDGGFSDAGLHFFDAETLETRSLNVEAENADILLIFSARICVSPHRIREPE
jgi:hypothetical protein